MTKYKLLFILAFLLISNTALAITNEQITACAIETDNTKRLACYDQLAESIGSANDITEADSTGNWLFKTLVDESSGVAILRLQVESKSSLETEGKPVRPILAITCEAGRVSVSLNWQLTLGRDSIRMRTYFDNMPHRSAVWSIADDFKTVTPRRGDTRLVKQMIQHSSLAAEITPFGGRPANAEFDITGLDEAIKPIREACDF